MGGLTTLFNFGQNQLNDPIYFEQDYTSEFGILKNFSFDDITNRILFFIPHWIKKSVGSNTQKIIQGIVTENSGLTYLFSCLKTLIKDCFISTAVQDGLKQLGLDLTMLYPNEHEHDWHFRYRIYEKIFEMKPTRSSLDRLILKWLGVESIEYTGNDFTYDSTIQKYVLPETYFYYVYKNYYKDLIITKNGEKLIKDLHYSEIGKEGRKSRIIHFLDYIEDQDIINIEIINHNPNKKITITGQDLEYIDLYKIILPSTHKYVVGEVEDINLRVFKNQDMLRRFDDYLETGIETETSQTVLFYEKPETTDTFRFEILGHYNSQGFFMVNSNHRILEQNQYGHYGGASYICSSEQILNKYDLVNYDSVNFTAVKADASLNIECNGIVNGIIGTTSNPLYVIQTREEIVNKTLNTDRTYQWDFSSHINDDVYLGNNGQITFIAPTSPDTVQIIGKVHAEHGFILDSSIGQGITPRHIYYRCPTAKFNKPATIYIIIKNAINYGADFYNYNPITSFNGSDYTTVVLKGTDNQNIVKPCLQFYSLVRGVLPTPNRVTVKNGSTPDKKTIIINESQSSEEIYTDLDMNEEFSASYIVDVINNNSSVVSVRRLTELTDSTLPNNTSLTPLIIVPYTYYHGDETSNLNYGISFYGIDHLIHFNGIIENSILDKMMKEINYCKTVGIRVIYDLHPKEISYKTNRYVSTI